MKANSCTAFGAGTIVGLSTGIHDAASNYWHWTDGQQNFWFFAGIVPIFILTGITMVFGTAYIEAASHDRWRDCPKIVGRQFCWLIGGALGMALGAMFSGLFRY